jgi:hypothetical protein
MAWLSVRFPRRESRRTGHFGLAEDHSIGVVPLSAANRSAEPSDVADLADDDRLIGFQRGVMVGSRSQLGLPA